LVKLVLEGTNGKNIIYSFQTSGNFVCLSALYNDDNFPYTIEAMSKTTVCLIRKDALLELQNKNIEINKLIFEWYIKEHKEMYNKMLALGTKNMPGRLADALLSISQEKYQKEEIFNYLTRIEIAEFSAMSLESMMKYFTEFKNDKLIEVKGKEIFINNRTMLERLSRIS